MSTERGLWPEGRRAWERLAGWYREGGSTPVPHETTDPLAALSDIGLVRRLLDEVELEAVRSARQRGRSWAEIATKLGVTRQSAWERWRDLDTERPTAAVALEGARRAGRTAWVVVPNVVGLPLDEARTLLAGRRLVGVSSGPDGPAAVSAVPGALVTDQSPEAGATVQPGSPVTLWTERGGGSGDREPRDPKPTPRTGRKYLDEPSEEAVG